MIVYWQRYIYMDSIMGKLIVLMGKSASGKDTIFNLLKEDDSLDLQLLVPYTTRPKRAGEVDGETYHFVTEEEFVRLSQEERIIEARSYNTVYGIWRYFTVKDDQLDLSKHSYLLIATLEAYLQIVQYFGTEKVLPIMITLDDGVRLERALQRERAEKQPKYEEMCRRFLADSADYAAEKIKAAGIHTLFENDTLEKTVSEIRDYIRCEVDGR